ncbi:putative Zn finger-like uncharacterized protein [Pseudomonas sp. URIL14HWK12:I3]|uniref:DUF3426 domain-containing protein n=1 Tax=Pseudomonas TaxID=286 RepID=UPI000DACF00C|nr:MULTISPECIES: DUF3426 domain-containing protein [unclassified Pseudomonas]PZW55935.1 putative Zn finger-like uncharacterized protein [Pseudomonas sp. URIL14HWK12:I2]PZW57832.1 putative Zn finger-like uncharacterized protein [Pseudomonas sp. URIL14HWK12:I3]QDC06121.1 DUF3426 domain-containing protein [Pseudomonas sp. SWI7]
MTDSFVTQCPHCQTSFRVTHHQLSVARGVVRCGQCLQVFNAAKQLLEQNRSAPLPPSPLPATEAAPAPAAPTPAHVHPIAPDDEAWAQTAQALDELDLDKELERLERRHAPVQVREADQASMLQAWRHEEDADEHLDEVFGTAAGEPFEPEQAAAAPVLEPAPQADSRREARTEPTFTAGLDADAEDEPPLGSIVTDEDEPKLGAPLRPEDDDEVSIAGLTAHDDEPLATSLRADDEHDEAPLPMGRMEPEVTDKAERPRRKEPLVDVVDDPLQLGWEKPAPAWGKRLLWGGLTLIAAAMLALQYVWFHFDELSRQDQYRPLFEQVCPAVGCQVPSRVDVNRIKSSNLVVRSHPDFKGALIVDAIIYNRAPFAQPFPLLELRFSDLNGQLIASRRFKPAEYLSGELAGRGEMPSQTPIHIALDILDPGQRAVNYSLSFRSPE